jgi:hypothetical protein
MPREVGSPADGEEIWREAALEVIEGVPYAS